LVEYSILPSIFYSFLFTFGVGLQKNYIMKSTTSKYLFKKILFLPLFFLSFSVKAQDATQKLSRFYEILNQHYVENINDNELTEVAIKSILSELDPHSSYISSEDVAKFQTSRDGEFKGVGILFSMISDTATVSTVYHDSPANKAGLLKGDKIVSIDNQSVIGFDSDKVGGLLKGASGTQVKLGVVRNEKLSNFDITRGSVLPSIKTYYKINDTTAFIVVSRFSHTTMREFSDAFYEMKNIRALILDLRGNGGGMIAEALKLANFFLKKGTLLGSNKGQSVPSSNYVAENDSGFDGKLIVLADENTASASELFLGAVQDWDRAVIVGRRTFGKAMIMQNFNLPDGSLIEITNSYNYTPSGRSIQRVYDKNKKEDYRNTIWERYDENFIDSIDRSLPEYKTLKLSRSVYGRDGIYPDFYVKTPSGWLNPYTLELLKNRIINNYIESYVEENKTELLKKYSSFQSFNQSFNITSQMIEEIVKAAEEKGIPKDAINLKKGEDYIKIKSKSMIIETLWSMKELYMFAESVDPDMIRAKEILTDWDKLVKNKEVAE